jgi:Na+-driven multidrug efflux pump
MIRGEGNPRIAMLTMLISVALNVVLAWLLVLQFGLGMRGAGLATAASQAVSAVWVTAYFLGRHSVLRLRARNLRLRRNICLAIVAIGSPLFAMQLAASAVNGVLNNQLRWYGGDQAIAVMGILFSVLMMFAMPIYGINQGAQPIISYNHGAKRFDRVKRTLQTAILAATALTTTGFLLAMALPARLVGLFTRPDVDPGLLDLGVHAMRITFAMLPIIGFQIVSASYFQAVGKPGQAMFLSLSRQVLLLIPAALILPRYFGLDGVWAAIPSADLGSSVLTGLWLFLELRHLRRRHAETADPA